LFDARHQSAPSFLPFGPGWVLVGDAGYTKDPVTAQGIANAFVDAGRVTTALCEVWSGAVSFEEALGRYQIERDNAALPMYEFTTQLATREPPPPCWKARARDRVDSWRRPARD
jgi:2-polyprenyl-6-methoxyphenol hydroxylase-like FAD-dependent oxidoreductase